MMPSGFFLCVEVCRREERKKRKGKERKEEKKSFYYWHLTYEKTVYKWELVNARKWKQQSSVDDEDLWEHEEMRWSLEDDMLI